MTEIILSRIHHNDNQMSPGAIRRTSMKSRLAILITATAVAVAVTPDAGAIPPLARKYRTSCQTCHVMIPALNSFGEAVRLNGYQIPDAEEALVKDEPLNLGSEPWKQMWPRAIWPSDLPGIPPIGVRIISDVLFTREQAKAYSSNFEFPHEVELLAGGRMGEKVGFFGELEWEPDSGVSGKQVYLIVNGLLSPFGAPNEALSARVGLFDLQFLLAHNNTTRAGRSNPLWGNKRLSDATIGGLVSGDHFRLQNNQPGVELNGIIARRLYWGAGIVNGNGEAAEDDNNHKDPYYKVKLKIVGRDFLGRKGNAPTSEATEIGGAWSDGELLLEQFGYFGQGVAKGIEDEFRYFGTAIRGVNRGLDLSLGYVWGDHDQPFGTDSPAGVQVKSWFAKAEYLVFPWLMARVAYEDLQFAAGAPLDTGASTLDQQRLLMGPVFAPLANLRIAIEWEKYLDHDGVAAGATKPDNLWIRLDWAF